MECCQACVLLRSWQDEVTFFGGYCFFKIQCAFVGFSAGYKEHRRPIPERSKKTLEELENKAAVSPQIED